MSHFTDLHSVFKMFGPDLIQYDLQSMNTDLNYSSINKEVHRNVVCRSISM